MAAERGLQGARHDEIRPWKRSGWRRQRWRKPKEVAQSAREFAVLEEELARVQYGPAAETPAAVATELARCTNKTLGDMKKFNNIPQDHVNEMETPMKTLVEGVARLATSFSQKAVDEMELEESKADGAKSSRYNRIWTRERRTPAHNGIGGANRGVAGHGRSHRVNIANPCARCGRDEKRHWPEQFSEFKSPWGEVGSNERTNSWQEVAHTTSVLPPQMWGRCATRERAQPSREAELYLAGLPCWRSKWRDAAWTSASRRVGRRRTR